MAFPRGVTLDGALTAVVSSKPSAWIILSISPGCVSVIVWFFLSLLIITPNNPVASFSTLKTIPSPQILLSSSSTTD
eukprot:11630532-Ditylum_brightwellii.AAC.1